MTTQTTAHAVRRTFPLSTFHHALAHIRPQAAASRDQPCAARLSPAELRQLVAAMVD